MYIKIKFRQIEGRLDPDTDEVYFYGNTFQNINEAVQKYNQLLIYKLECEKFITDQSSCWSELR